MLSEGRGLAAGLRCEGVAGPPFLFPRARRNSNSQARLISRNQPMALAYDPRSRHAKEILRRHAAPCGAPDCNGFEGRTTHAPTNTVRLHALERKRAKC